MASTACVSSAAVRPAVAASRRSMLGNIAGLAPTLPARSSRSGLVVRAEKSLGPQAVQPINGDPFIGMLETPVTSSPLVANFLSNLPAYRIGVSPLLRGVEIGLVHGFFLPGPFIKLGPLRNVPEIAERAGCLSAAGLVLILTLCLTIYAQGLFTEDIPKVGVKTLSGRDVKPDPLQTKDGWSEFASGWAVGGLSGVAWCYILTQTLPFYS